MSATVAQIERTVFQHFPSEWAAPWDRVGLIAGDGSSQVERVLVSLDVTPEAVDRAVAAGANVLVTHHPVGLSPLERVTAGSGVSGTVFAAIRAGVALIAAHTNLDRSPAGLAALPKLLELTPTGPVERSNQPMSRVTCFVPAEAAEAIVSAMAAAGAGRVGAYERCAFSVAGVGEFDALPGARPAVGGSGSTNRVDEVRVEMVCAPADAVRVVAAARSEHPYEEPLIVVDEVEIARGATGLGMRCLVEGGLTVGELARRAAERLGASPRVWGDPARSIRSVVAATGSASSLLGDVRASGADALVCGEVRYHDALSASGEGLAIIECGHDKSEWPLVPVLADAVRATPGIDAESVIVDEPPAVWQAM